MKWFSILGLCAFAATIAACSNDDDTASVVPPPVIEGQSGAFLGSTVKTWAMLRADGSVSEVGATLPYGVIENAGGEMQVVRLEVPQIVRETTFVDHIEFYWEPMGHPPAGIFDKPHFDLHFYRSRIADVASIDCTDKTMPPPSLVPTGYLLPEPTAPDVCVPGMGIHAAQAADVSPGALFSKSMIVGYYRGVFTFIEPMVTREALQQRQSFELDIPTPASLGGTETRFPTKFEGRFDVINNQYDLVLSGFTSIDSVP